MENRQKKTNLVKIPQNDALNIIDWAKNNKTEKLKEYCSKLPNPSDNKYNPKTLMEYFLKVLLPNINQDDTTALNLNKFENALKEAHKHLKEIR